MNNPPPEGQSGRALARAMSSDLPSCLYARLLGPAWHDLPRSVQELHGTSSAEPRRGRMQVRHGHHRMTRMLARLLGLPREAASVDLTLIVEQHSPGERWIRRFGEVLIATVQRADGELLYERFGFLEFWFRLEAADGRLFFRQRQAAVRLAGCSLRLPSWLAPRILADEKGSDTGDAVEVSVEVSLPGLGLLLAYRGVVEGREGGRL